MEICILCDKESVKDEAKLICELCKIRIQENADKMICVVCEKEPLKDKTSYICESCRIQTPENIEAWKEFDKAIKKYETLQKRLAYWRSVEDKKWFKVFTRVGTVIILLVSYKVIIA